MTRILIADDHDVVRAGLRTILQSQAGWEVVAEASDGKEAVELALATRPDVAVLDFGLPTLNGVEATRQIRSKLSRVEILIFTMHDTDASSGTCSRLVHADFSSSPTPAASSSPRSRHSLITSPSSPAKSRRRYLRAFCS